jgi:N-acetylmuramoyl-L-alanine amidase
MRYEEAHLTINPFSRPGTPLIEQRGILLHWQGNAGKDPWFMYRYMENQKHQDIEDDDAIYSSAHFGVGAEIVLNFIPTGEIAYHGGAHPGGYTELARKRFAPHPWMYLIGVEICHPDDSGWFPPSVLNNAVELCSWICRRKCWNPLEDSTWRHYDMTGKPCPAWWVLHPECFEQFKEDVSQHMKRHHVFDKGRTRFEWEESL